MISREKALEILLENMQNQNLRRHCYAVEATMKALALHFDEDQEKWGILGLLHDADYEKTKDKPEEHTLLMNEWLKEAGETDEEIFHAILSHNAKKTGKEGPASKMEWALECCDELTGFIVAIALVMPEKKLLSVTPESVLKKFPQKAFAAAVDREQISQCQEQLGISLEEFVKITLESMQGISGQLGL